MTMFLCNVPPTLPRQGSSIQVLVFSKLLPKRDEAQNGILPHAGFHEEAAVFGCE